MPSATQTPPSTQSVTESLSAWFMRPTPSRAVRSLPALHAALGSDIGAMRSENQDRAALVRGRDRSGAPFILAAVADGMGGMLSGDQCASLAMATFIVELMAAAQRGGNGRQWLRAAAIKANDKVHERFWGHGGATLSAVLLSRDGQAFWLNVGDSRVYHAAGVFLDQLSTDDTEEAQLGLGVEEGMSAGLLQFVGIGEEFELHIEALPADLKGHLLLTTDGVHFIDRASLAKVAYFAADLEECVRRLIAMAQMLGGPDNAAVVALEADALANAGDFPRMADFEVWDPFGDLHVIAGLAT